MIAVTNTAAVTLEVGQALTFNNISWKSGCAESFRGNTAAVRAGNGIYEITFNGNVTGAAAAAQVQLSIAVDGTALPETTMISTPSTALLFNNVSAQTWVGNQANCCNPCPGSISISVVNAGTVAVTVAPNARLSVKRIG